ncbi:hypothetical protein [Amycolatopsis sp. NPDC051903]|uniref:hypothetical protein n=1 Tax=Amycolatopsis sp. NPDC051903 TaxID=3363936 RepID=UPI0037B9C17B
MAGVVEVGVGGSLLLGGSDDVGGDAGTTAATGVSCRVLAVIAIAVVRTVAVRPAAASVHLRGRAMSGQRAERLSCSGFRLFVSCVLL